MARRMLTTLGRPKLASFLKRWTIPRPPPRNLNPAQGPSWTRSHLYLTDDTEAYHLPVHIPSHRSILNYPITTSENLTAHRGFFAGGVVVQDRSEGVVLDSQPHASGNLYQTPLGPGQGNVGGRKASDCGHGVLAFLAVASPDTPCKYVVDTTVHIPSIFTDVFQYLLPVSRLP